MTCSYDTFLTPFGPFSVAVDAAGAVTATAFGGLTRLRERLANRESLQRKPAACALVKQQLLAYFEGTLLEFDVPLAPRGTEFQQRVWMLLQATPFGATCTYGQLAAHLGQPGAARAVGRANATNPLCVIVPCHRVIGANGALTGFAFGKRLKQRLLAHEKATAAPQPHLVAPAA